MDKAVIIAHQDGKEEMSRHGEQSAQNGREGPVVPSIEHILDVLKSRKAQPDTYGVDNAIEVFVKIRIPAQQQPQEEEFGQFLRQLL